MGSECCYVKETSFSWGAYFLGFFTPIALFLGIVVLPNWLF